MAHCYNSPSITRKGMKRVFAPVPNYFGGSMKKISAVLLVLVLVGSVVFAGFTGSATTSFGYNLDSGKYGFDNSKAVSVDVNFLEMVGEAKSSGDVYVDINATLTFSFSNADEDGLAPGSGDLNPTGGTPLIVKADFKHAKIVGDNWYVGILGAVRAANFATSAIDSKELGAGANDLLYAFDDKDYYADLRARDVFDRTSGIEVGYADWVLGLGLKGDAVDSPDSVGVFDETFYKVFASLVTPEFELADGLTAKFGMSGVLASETEEWGAGLGAAVAVAAEKAVSAHAKVAFEKDDLAVTVGTDVIADIENKDFDADVSLKAVYDIVTLDAYFATKSSYVNTDVAANTVAAPDNLLSTQVAVDLDPIVVKVAGKDLINKQNLSASVKYQATDELAVTGRGGYGIADKSWNGGADVEYKTSDFTAKLGGTYRSSERISVNASIESDTLVPGATLKLAYAGDDITEADPPVDPYDNGNKGKVLASVKIAF
jgi:hypothetical protein